MKRIRNKKGKIVEVQLEKGEQLWLIKENLKRLRVQKKVNEKWAMFTEEEIEYANELINKGKRKSAQIPQQV